MAGLHLQFRVLFCFELYSKFSLVKPLPLLDNISLSQKGESGLSQAETMYSEPILVQSDTCPYVAARGRDQHDTVDILKLCHSANVNTT